MPVDWVVIYIYIYIKIGKLVIWMIGDDVLCDSDAVVAEDEEDDVEDEDDDVCK